MTFDLMPYDDDIWQVAADYAEEQGFLIPKAIRDKVLPLDVKNGRGEGEASGKGRGNGCGHSLGFGSLNEDCILQNLFISNTYMSQGLAEGPGNGRGYGHGCGWGDGWRRE